MLRRQMTAPRWPRLGRSRQRRHDRHPAAVVVTVGQFDLMTKSPTIPSALRCIKTCRTNRIPLTLSNSFAHIQRLARWHWKKSGVATRQAVNPVYTIAGTISCPGDVSTLRNVWSVIVRGIGIYRKDMFVKPGYTSTSATPKLPASVEGITAEFHSSVDSAARRRSVGYRALTFLAMAQKITKPRPDVTFALNGY